jgi:excisionase family DNA binding protein
MTKHFKDNEQLAYGPADAARLIGHSRSGLYLLLASGAISSFKVGRKRLITRQSLLDFLQQAVEPVALSHKGGESTS